MKERWSYFEPSKKYMVSDHGRIKSFVRFPEGALMSPRHKKDGYVQLCMGRRWMSIHRAVAIAFIPNPENKPQVNHKDLNKSNNHVSNLEWATRLENAQHAKSNGALYKTTGKNHWTQKDPSRRKVGSLNGRAKLTWTLVREIRSLHKKFSYQQLAKKYGVSKCQIGYIIRKEQWVE